MKISLRRVVMVVLFVVLNSFLFLKLNITSLTAISDLPTIRVGIYDNSPKVYLDEHNQPTGLFPDILNFISKKEDITFQYIFGTWEECLNRLETGEIDLLVDVAISEGRQQKFEFTNETVYNSWGVVYAPQNSAIVSFRDLNNKKIAILKSSIYASGFESIDRYIQAYNLNVNMVYVNKQMDVFNLIDSGNVDAGIVSRTFAQANQKYYPNIKQTGLIFSPTELRFALTKGNPNNQILIEKIDYWMGKLKDGDKDTFQQILEKNGLAAPVKIKEVIPVWTKIIWFLEAIAITTLCFFVIKLIRAKIKSDKILKNNEEMYRSMIDAASRAGIGMVILQDVKSKQAVIVSANDFACKLAGFLPEEVINKLTIKDFLPEKIINMIMKKYIDRQQGKEAPNLYSLEIIHKNKTLVPVDLTLSVLKIKNKPATIVYFRDISENLKNQNALEKSQRQLRDIINFLPDATLAIDRDKRVIIWNNAIEKMTGIPAKDMLGKNNYEYTIPFYGDRRPSLMDLLWHDDKNTLKRYTSVKREGESLSAEVFCNALYHNKGAYVYAKATKLHDAQGNFIGAIESIRDITETKNAQNYLFQSEQRFRKFFENSPIGVTLMDKNTRFLSSNLSFCKLIGYTEDELKGLTCRDITHPDDLKKDHANAKELLSGKVNKTQVEKRYIKKDKSVIWTSLTVSVVRDENKKFMYFLAMVEDISERKKYQENLLSLNKNLKIEKSNLVKEQAKSMAILSSIGDGLFVVDLKGNIILINRGFTRLLGYPEKEVIGQKFISLIKAVDDNGNSIPDHLRPIMKSLKNGKDAVSQSLRGFNLVKKDKTLLPIAYRVSCVFIKGNIVGAVGVFRDVTSLIEVDKAKTDFVSIASHELRAPLGIMKAFISMIFDENYGPINKKLNTPLKEIQKSTDKLISLVNDILSVSKIEAGKTIYKITNVDTKKIIVDSISRFKTIANGNTVIKHGKLSTDFVKADPDKLSMILNNLISNAIKFTNQGVITIASKTIGNNVHFSISDTGIGIDRSDQKHIFEKFKQIITNETGKPSGSGLGLYISKSLIERMNGKIWLESSIVGKGSTFIFKLPKAPKIVKKK